MTGLLTDLASAIAQIRDGASVAITKSPPMSGLRQLIRHGTRELKLICVPTAGLGADLLIGSGAVRSIESGAVLLGELGAAPNYLRAAGAGELDVVESACPVIEMALQAGASGLDYTPVPGLIGSDLLRQRPDFRVIDDPFGRDRRDVLVPSIMPDVALIHGLRADLDGNVVVGIEFEDRLAVQAASVAVAIVEEVSPDATKSLEATEQVIPAVYFHAIAQVSRALFPLGCEPLYGENGSALAHYLSAAKDPDRMRAYLGEVTGTPEADYLARYAVVGI